MATKWSNPITPGTQAKLNTYPYTLNNTLVGPTPGQLYKAQTSDSRPGFPQLPGGTNLLPQIPQAPQYFIPYDKSTPRPYKVFNMDDPYEINSFADVFYKHLDVFRQREGDISDVPVIGVIADSATLIKEQLYDPLMAGDKAVAGINTLVNVGETLDTIANPVKALYQAAYNGDDIIKAVKDAVGQGGEGRKNFNWDTGNTVLDLALEIVSDPGNLPGFVKAAGTGLSKAAAKGASTELTEAGLKNYLDTFNKDVINSERLAQLVFSKSTWAAGNKVSADLVPHMQRKMMKEAFISIAQQGTKTTDDYAIQAMFRAYNEALEAVAKQTADNTAEQGMRAMANIVSDSFKLAEALAPLETIDNFLVRFSLGVPGIYHLTKNVLKFDPLNTIKNSLLNNVKRASVHNAIAKITDMDVKTMSISERMAHTRTIHTAYNNILAGVNPDEIDLDMLVVAVGLRQDSIDLLDIISNKAYSSTDKIRMIDKIAGQLDPTNIKNYEEYHSALVGLDETIKNLRDISNTGLERQVARSKKVLEYYHMLKLEVPLKKAQTRISNWRLDLNKMRTSLNKMTAKKPAMVAKGAEALPQDVITPSDFLGSARNIINNTNANKVRTDSWYKNKIDGYAKYKKKLQQELHALHKNDKFVTFTSDFNYQLNRMTTDKNGLWMPQDNPEYDIRFIEAAYNDVVRNENIITYTSNEGMLYRLPSDKTLVKTDVQLKRDINKYVPDARRQTLIKSEQKLVKKLYHNAMEIIRTLPTETILYNTRSSDLVQKIIAKYPQLSEHGEAVLHRVLDSRLRFEKIRAIDADIASFNRVIKDRAERIKANPKDLRNNSYFAGFFDGDVPNKDFIQFHTLLENLYYGKGLRTWEELINDPAILKLTHELVPTIMYKADGTTTLVSKYMDVSSASNYISEELSHLDTLGKYVNDDLLEVVEPNSSNLAAAKIAKILDKFALDHNLYTEGKTSETRISKSMDDLIRDVELLISDTLDTNVILTDLRNTFEIELSNMMPDLRDHLEDVLGPYGAFMDALDTLTELLDELPALQNIKTTKELLIKYDAIMDARVEVVAKAKHVEYLLDPLVKKQTTQSSLLAHTKKVTLTKLDDVTKDIKEREYIFKSIVDTVKELRNKGASNDSIKRFLGAEPFSKEWNLELIKNPKLIDVLKKAGAFEELFKLVPPKTIPQTLEDWDVYYRSIKDYRTPVREIYRKPLIDAENQIGYYEKLGGDAVALDELITDVRAYQNDILKILNIPASKSVQAGALPNSLKDYIKLTHTPVEQHARNTVAAVLKKGNVSIEQAKRIGQDVITGGPDSFKKTHEKITTLIDTLNKNYAHLGKQLPLEFDTTNVIYTLKMNNQTKAHELLTNPDLRALIETSGLAPIIDNIFNINNRAYAKSITDNLALLNINPANIWAVQELAILKDGSFDYFDLVNAIATAKWSPTNAKAAKTAAIDGLDYIKNIDVSSLQNPDAVIEQMVNKVNGYVGSVDPNLKSRELGALAERFLGLTEATRDEAVAKELGLDIGKIRHTAIGDAALTAMIYKSQNPGDYIGKVFMDTETTNMLGKFGTAEGRLMDMSMVRYVQDADGNVRLETIFNKQVQVSRDTLNTDGYQAGADVMRSIGITPLAYADKYLTKDGVEYLEEQMLLDFQKAIKDFGVVEMVTSNGEKFDLPYIYSRGKSYGLKIADDLKGVKHTDYLKDLRAADGMAKLDSNDELLLRNIYSDYINTRVRRADIYRKFGHNKPVPLLKSIDDGVMSALSVLAGLEDAEFANIIKTADLDLLDDQTKRWVEAKAYVDGKLMRFQESASKGYHLEDDQQLVGAAQKALSSLIEELKSVSAANAAFRKTPFGDSLFRPEKQAQLKALQEAIAEHITDPEAKAKFLASTPKNMTQLLYAEESMFPTFAYKKDSTALFELIDAKSKEIVLEPILNKAGMVVGEKYVLKGNVHYTNYRQAMNFAKRISALAQESWNVRVLKTEGQADRIKAALQFFKEQDPTLSQTFGFIKIDPNDLRHNVATLEAIYFNTKARLTSLGTESKDKAVQNMIDAYTNILETFKKDFTELDDVINSGLIHARSFKDTNILKLEYDILNKSDEDDFLEYANTIMNAKTLDDVNKTKILNAELQEAQDAFNNNGYNIKLNQATVSNSTSSALQDLNNGLIKTFDADGRPTGATRTYKRVAQGMQDIGAVWETANIMSLSDQNLIATIIDNGANTKWISFGRRATENKYGIPTRMLQEQLLARKKSLKELGVDIVEEDGFIRAYLNPELMTRIVPDANRPGHFLLDGKPVISPELPELDINDYYKLLGEDDETKGMIDLFYTTRSKMIKMNPEFSGRLGITNYAKGYDAQLANPSFAAIRDKVGSSIDETLDKPSMFANWNLGSIEDRAVLIPGINRGADSTLNLLGNKMINHTNSHMEYAMSIMDDALSFDNEIFKGMTDDEIIKAINDREDLAIVYLKDDPGYTAGFRLEKLGMADKNVLANADRLGIRILPYDLYEKAYTTINTFSYKDNTFLGVWSKYITALKAGYLINIGTMFRNMLDSTIKTMVANGSVVDGAKRMSEAMVLLTKYEQTLKQIRKLDPNGTFKKANAILFFDTMKGALSKEEFEFVYKFISNSGAVSIADEVDGLWQAAMRPNAWIEQTARLAQHLDLASKGFGDAVIAKRISATHFNYDMKSRSDKIIEMFIPFWYYLKNSMVYFASEVAKHPHLVKQFMNGYLELSGIQDESYSDIAYNKSVQYRILAGNIPLKNIMPGVDSEITLKTGYSLLDGLLTSVNPIGNLQQKMAAPLVYASEQLQLIDGSTEPEDTKTKLLEAMQLVPFAGVTQQRIASGLTNFDRTGNPLNVISPTLFGSTKRYERKQYIKPIARRKAKKKYVKRYYAKRPRSYYYNDTISPWTSYKAHMFKVSHPNYSNTHAGRIRNVNFYKNMYTNRGRHRAQAQINRKPVDSVKYSLRYG